MDTVLTQDLLREMARRLQAEFHPDAIYLFGSQVGRSSRSDSDVDLLVVVPDSPENAYRRAVRARRCLRGIPVAVDVIVETRADIERRRRAGNPFVARILAEGRRIDGQNVS